VPALFEKWRSPLYPRATLLLREHNSGNGDGCLFKTRKRPPHVTILYTFIYSLALGTIAPLSPFIPKLLRGLRGRHQLLERLKASIIPQQSPYWFHVASSGEFEQVLPLLDALKKEKPDCQVILTFFSPSAEKAVRLERERREKNGVAVSWDHADFSPFDFPWSVSHFLDTAKPLAFIAIHREIWPNILTECANRNIPTYLFAAFFPERTQKNFWLYRRWISLFKKIGAVDQQTQDFLQRELPQTPIQRIGDPRAQRVLARRKMQKPPPWDSFFSKQRVFIGASLWEKDFEALRPSLEVILEQKNRIILVPHEPTDRFMREMLDWLKQRGQPARLWSSWLLSPDETSHLVVDSVGLLAELYSIAHLVFVGGSFVGRIHNILEPAAYGKPILTGPYIWNSAQAKEWNARGIGLKSAQNAEELRNQTKKLLQDETLYLQWSNFLTESLQDATNIPTRYLQLL
jgi:3-deoxy-D-manno-octulosonic-acid transferase